VTLSAGEVKSSFPPIVDVETRILVLGTLPGEMSLAKGEYYANPQNLFWRLVGAAIEADLDPRRLAYADRLAALKAARVGLWDVVKSAERAGSLDAAIRNHAPNALPALAATLPALRAVGFNGATSWRIGAPQLADADFALVKLPSSSPAYASMSFDAKRAEWLRLRAFLR
jgi:hypoxanthine-DNA glycosylase